MIQNRKQSKGLDTKKKSIVQISRGLQLSNPFDFLVWISLICKMLYGLNRLHIPSASLVAVSSLIFRFLALTTVLKVVIKAARVFSDSKTSWSCSLSKTSD